MEKKQNPVGGQMYTFAPDGEGTPRPTVCCCHCARHYDPGPDGVLWGWCDRCEKATCGPACAHVPPEVYLDRIQRGEDPAYPPMGPAAPATVPQDAGFFSFVG